MHLRIPATHRMVVCYHSEVGHRYVPSLRARIPSERGGYYVVTNGAGFRSDVEFVAARSSRPRILFFGGSFTAGDGCHNAERYPERVGAALDAEAYNYAVTGTSVDQQLLVYERLARHVAADLVVIAVLVEDIEHNKAAFRESIDRASKRRILAPKPYFVLENGGLALHHVPVPRERRWADGASHPPGDPLLRLVQEPLRRLRSDPRLRAARAAVEGRMPWLVPSVRKHTSTQPHADYASSESEGWRLMQAILVRFTEAAAPTPVLIVPVPGRPFYHDGLEPIYQPLFERLSAPGRGVHVLDLTRPLFELSWADKRRLTFERDGGFSPFGHEEVARVVTGAIRSRGLLAVAPASRDVAAPSMAAPMTLKSSDVSPAVAVSHTGVRGARGRAPTYVLGISCFDRDSAAALIRDGEILAAAEEARFSGVANDRSFPAGAANYCLEEAGIEQRDLAAVVHCDQAPLTFERVLHTLAAHSAGGREAWDRTLPPWLRYKLHVSRLLREHLAYEGLVLNGLYPRSHAASAFYPSPFDRAAIVTLGGVGEWSTGSIGVGGGREIELLQEMRFPHSIGLLHSAFSELAGFSRGSGEREMTALAPRGEPRYREAILDHLVDLKADGSIELDLSYFTFLSRQQMTNERFAALFGGPARRPEGPITQRERDLARSIQVVIEEAVVRTARHAQQLTGENRLCLAGVALDRAVVRRLLREASFADVWIQPAAGEACGAVGAALDVHHTYFEKPRTLPANGSPSRGGGFSGPSYSDQEIQAFLETRGYPHRALGRRDELTAILAAGKVVGHFSGRPASGPRAPGARGGEEEAIDVRDEPVVGSPDDAYRCFMRTAMDHLLMGNFLLDKQAQPPWAEPGGGADLHEPEAFHDGAASGPKPRPPAEAYPQGFTAAVSSAFFTDFLPQVRGLPGESIRVSTALRRLPTTWSEVRRPADRKEAFAIPPALDADTPDPVSLAGAITSFWEPGPATDAMRGVVVKLLEINARFPDPEHGEQSRDDDDGSLARVLSVVY